VSLRRPHRDRTCERARARYRIYGQWPLVSHAPNCQFRDTPEIPPTNAGVIPVGVRGFTAGPLPSRDITAKLCASHVNEIRSLRFHTRNHVELTKNRLHRDRDAVREAERRSARVLLILPVRQDQTSSVLNYARTKWGIRCVYLRRTYAQPPVNRCPTENYNNVKHDYSPLGGQQ